MERVQEERLIKPCVIEFQAFRGNDDRYIIKELVILDLFTFVIHPFTFEAPFSFNMLNSKARTTNKWLTKYFHRIQWYEGYINYNNLHSIMYQFCKQYTHIYTRGCEKRNWIQRYTHGKVIDVHMNRDFQYDLGDCCVTNPTHRYSQCALRNAYRVAAYLEKNNICGGGGGNNGGYKYRRVTRKQHQCYTRLRGGNISDDTASKNDITTVSAITS